MNTDKHRYRNSGGANEYVDMKVRVRYAETDRMGVAYYANHFVWFELGRTEFFRQRGHLYRELEEQEGCYIIVTEARCRYHSPARYDEVLTVRTRLKEARSRSVAFSYEVRAEDGRAVATGETLHVITDRAGKPRTLPARYRQALLGREDKETAAPQRHRGDRERLIRF